jgi:Domain of unknown function (DUF222)/HNH endonuclease
MPVVRSEWFVTSLRSPAGKAQLRRLPPVRGVYPGSARYGPLVELAHRQLDSGQLPSSGGQKPHLFLTADVATLTSQPGCEPGLLEWVGPVSSETVRRFACDAALTPILRGQDGQLLGVGRTTRVIKPSLRKALLARDRGCRFPGCDRPAIWTDGHHLIPWALGGATELDNLLSACRRHHLMAHEGGWRLEWTPDGGVRAIPP